MKIFSFFKNYGWVFAFIILSFTTASIEVYSLHWLLGWEPYIFIAALVCGFEAFMLLNIKGKLSIVLALLLMTITTFFAVQIPLSSILNNQNNKAKLSYYESLIDRTKIEYDSLKADYKSNQNILSIAQKDRAWGIIRDYEKNNTLGVISEKVELKKVELNNYEQQLLSYNEKNNSWYLSFVRLLTIVAAKIMLVIASQKVKLRHIKIDHVETLINEVQPQIIEPILKQKRKYTKKPKINNTFLESDI
jgi:hypothetical protein